jgi:hypothetical protein
MLYDPYWSLCNADWIGVNFTVGCITNDYLEMFVCVVKTSAFLPDLDYFERPSVWTYHKIPVLFAYSSYTVVFIVCFQCSKDSRTIPDNVLQFTKARPLMDLLVSSETGQPIFYRQDVMYTKIVTDKVREFDVYFLVTGELILLYDICRWHYCV